MAKRINSDVEVELHDVFEVQQLTRDTPIEEVVGADLVTMDAGQNSDPHRHNFSETVLFFTAGKAVVRINDKPYDVKVGDRILIHKTEFHSVSTPGDSGCAFISVQTPPILTKAIGIRDLETLETANAAGTVKPRRN